MVVVVVVEVVMENGEGNNGGIFRYIYIYI